MKKRDYVARLTIYGLPEMNLAQYKSLVDWLYQQVNEFKKEKDHKIYAKNYTAKLMK